MRGHFFNKPPNWLKFITPGLTWLLPNDDKIIYLTFDDGPVEKATPYVRSMFLRLLKLITWSWVILPTPKYWASGCAK